MHVRLRLDRSTMRGWQVELARRIGARGANIDVEQCPAVNRLSRNALRLFAFEARVHGRTPTPLSDAASAGLVPDRQFQGRPDRIIDLSGCGEVAPGVWQLVFDGQPGEAGLFAALLAGRSPVAALQDGSVTVASGRLGTDSPGQVRASFEDALARTVTLVLAALDDGPVDAPLSAEHPSVEVSTLSLPRLGALLAQRCVAAAGRRVRRLRHPEPNWRVGWRRLEGGPDLFDLRRHPKSGWIDLADDGSRFYADPFPIEHGGAVVLFVEEYPHASGKGIISAVRFGTDGPEGRPEPVLERPYHLSYPFVFARDGEIWMIPESSSAGTVELYRATAFPGGWLREAVLIEGVTAGDATLLEHDGQWWMFATVRDGGGSTTDSLHLWSAPDFRGPWTPHPRNPVLIDNASARPAGRVVRRSGQLLRPVQDCRGAYGAALGIARIDALGPETYAQTVETILRPGSPWSGHLLHTVNRAGAYEFIDGSGQGGRPMFGRRPGRD